MKRHEMTEEQPVTARKAKAWRKARKRQPDNAKWNLVLAEYRSSMVGPAGAIRPVEKGVHPIPAMEPARCPEAHFEELIAQDIVNETALIFDSTTIKVHQHGSGAKKGPRRAGT